MAVTKPYEFIGFGAMAVTKPYEFTGFGAMAKGLAREEQGESPDVPRAQGQGVFVSRLLSELSKTIHKLTNTVLKPF